MAKEQALDLRQRQYADDFDAASSEQVVRAVSKYVFDDVAPFDTMKEGRVRTVVDERCPGRTVVLCERSHRQRHTTSRVLRSHVASRSKMRSIRSHRKSLSNCRNLRSVRLRLT